MSQVVQMQQVTGHFYLYAKSQGTNGDEVIICIFPLEQGKQK